MYHTVVSIEKTTSFRPFPASVSFFGDGGGRWLVPYHYESSVSAAASSGAGENAKRTRRLAQEIVTLVEINFI